MVLEFKKVTRKKLLLETNLSIDDGKTVLLLSEDSNNSSDILKMIMDLKKPTSGKILLFSKDVKRDIDKLKSSLAYISNLKTKKDTSTAYSFLIRTASFYKADFKEDINNLLNKFNLDPNKRICDMTKYEKLNLSIINSLFYKPSLILIDNILDELDDTSRCVLDNILNDFKKSGTTIVIAASRCNITNIDEIYYYKDNQLIQNNDFKQYNKIIIKSTAKIDDSNIFNVIKDNNLTSFIYKGDVNNIIKKYEIVDIYKPYIKEIIDLWIQN